MGDASMIPAMRDARVDANAEAGSSEQPAAGGQRNANRKR